MNHLKRFVIVALTALALPALAAQAETLNCTVTKNAEKVLTQKVEALPDVVTHFGEVDGFVFMVRNLGPAAYELQIFDPSVPARSYVEGTLRTATDKLSWSYWSRDILLETSCTLASPARR